MVGPSHSHLKTSHPFSLNSSSSLSSMKMKSLIQTLFYSHFSRIIGAFSNAKSIIIHTLKENQAIHFILYPRKKQKKKKHKKILFGSFRLHYNWCSSHVLPETHIFYDSTEQCHEAGSESQLSGYLQWLEEKPNEEEEEEDKVNEIDKLADMFIANCHEKFLLEKVESYRRFQEMLARSV